MVTKLDAALENAKLSDLIAHIESSHHTFTRQELKHIENRLATMPAAILPEREEIARVFNKLNNELIPHLMKEENILFPYLVALEYDPRNPPYSYFGTVANPIYMMQVEHASCLAQLEQLRALTKGYSPGPQADASMIELYAALAGLDDDLVQHIHWEDDVLFPRALQLESASH